MTLWSLPKPWVHHTWLQLTSLEIHIVFSSPCCLLQDGWDRSFPHVCGFFLNVQPVRVAGRGSPSLRDFGDEDAADQPSWHLRRWLEQTTPKANTSLIPPWFAPGLAPGRWWHTRQGVQLHRKAGIHLIRVKKIKLKHPSPPNPCMNQQSWLQHPKALRLKPFPRAQVRTGHNKRVIKSPIFAVNCVSAGDLVL